LPALVRAAKIQKKAKKIGLDWSHANEVIDKIEEELSELKTAISSHQTQQTEITAENIQEELGDLLFSVVNLSRHLTVNAEQSLRQSTDKFIQRAERVAAMLKQRAESAGETSAAELDQLWQTTKQQD